MTSSVAAPLAVQPVGERTLLLVWEGEPAPRSARLSVRIGGARVGVPHALVRLPLPAGLSRNILAVRARQRAGSAPAEIVDREGGTIARLVCEAEAWQHTRGFDAPLLAGGLAARERGRLLRFLAEVCGPLFQLQQDPAFGTALRALLPEIVAAAGRMVARCRLPSGFVLCETVVPEGLGEHLSAVLIGSDAVARVAVRPGYLTRDRARPGVATVALILPAAAAAAVLIFGEGGLVRRVPAGFGTELPFVHAWFAAASGARAEHRRFILDRLCDGSVGGRPAEALCRELRASVAAGGGVEAAADLVVASDGTLLVIGRLADPHGLVEHIEVERRGVCRSVPLSTLVRFDRRDPAPVAGRGFVLRLTDRGPAAAPVSLALRLGSSALLPFGEGPSALSPAEAQGALLEALPGEPADDRLLSAIEPVFRDLCRARTEAAAVRNVVDIGRTPAHPKISVLVPFCMDAELLRCRMGVLAADPTVAEAEFLYLVEDDRNASAAAQLLSALHTGYGVSSRAVVFTGRPPLGRMIELAAELAAGSRVALLGRNAVPEAPGWLAELAGHLDRTPQCAIVGAQAINPDHSLLCAGYAIGTDAAAEGWSLRPLLQGFPRDYPPAAEPARVASLPAECLLLGRALARTLIAPAGDLLMPASVVAAMCLGARARGFDVWRLPVPAVVTWRRDGREEAPEARHGLIAELERRHLARLYAAQAETAAPAKRTALAPGLCALLPRRRVA